MQLVCPDIHGCTNTGGVGGGFPLRGFAIDGEMRERKERKRGKKESRKRTLLSPLSSFLSLSTSLSKTAPCAFLFSTKTQSLVCAGGFTIGISLASPVPVILSSKIPWLHSLKRTNLAYEFLSSKWGCAFTFQPCGFD